MSYYKDGIEAFNDGNYRKAIHCYIKYIEETDTEDNNFSGYYNLGVCYIKLYRKENNDTNHLYEAEKYLKLALEYTKDIENSRVACAAHNLTFVYSKLNNYKLAYIYCKFAISLCPEDEDIVNAFKIIENKFFEIIKNEIIK